MQATARHRQTPPTGQSLTPHPQPPHATVYAHWDPQTGVFQKDPDRPRRFRAPALDGLSDLPWGLRALLHLLRKMRYRAREVNVQLGGGLRDAHIKAELYRRFFVACSWLDCKNGFYPPNGGNRPLRRAVGRPLFGLAHCPLVCRPTANNDANCAGFIKRPLANGMNNQHYRPEVQIRGY